MGRRARPGTPITGDSTVAQARLIHIIHRYCCVPKSSRAQGQRRIGIRHICKHGFGTCLLDTQDIAVIPGYRDGQAPYGIQPCCRLVSRPCAARGSPMPEVSRGRDLLATRRAPPAADGRGSGRDPPRCLPRCWPGGPTPERLGTPGFRLPAQD